MFFYCNVGSLPLVLSITLQVLSHVVENYLLALCEGGREKELLKLYEIIDITKMSVNCAAAIFKSLGKVQLDAFVEKFLNAFKARGKFISWNQFLS